MRRKPHAKNNRVLRLHPQELVSALSMLSIANLDKFVKYFCGFLFKKYKEVLSWQ